jgi:hypothetical protein
LVGQNNLNNTVILYNIVPLRVDLNVDGTIKKIYGEDNNFLRGYKVVRREPKQIIDPLEYSNSLNNFVSRVTENYEIKFSGQSSYLEEAIIQSLDKSADYIFFNKGKLVINSYKKSDDTKSIRRYKDRLNNMLAYLDIKGVKKEDIIINLDELTESDQDFKITFVE